MLYAIFCYAPEDIVGAWTQEEDDAAIGRLLAVQEKKRAEGKLGPVARLVPTSAATTIRKGKEPIVMDGPFAETKEQLLGFYVVEAENLDEALDFAKELSIANGGPGAHEVRPLRYFAANQKP